MTAVYTKIIRTSTPIEKIRSYLKGSGIDWMTLGESAGIHQITIKLVCSDHNPSQKRTQKDIDNLLMKLTDVKELEGQSQRNDPSKNMNHALQISVDKDSEQEGEIQGQSKEVERG